MQVGDVGAMTAVNLMVTRIFSLSDMRSVKSSVTWNTTDNIIYIVYKLPVKDVYCSRMSTFGACASYLYVKMYYYHSIIIIFSHSQQARVARHLFEGWGINALEGG